MTLNLTVLTANAIFQSADRRLSTAGHAEVEPSSKRIVLTSPEWTGFITYAGVGRVGTRHTSDEVRSWLSGFDGSFGETVDLVFQRAGPWLRRVGWQRHTFVIAAFDGPLPKAVILSNFERWHGQADGSLWPSFELSVVAGGAEPQVIVTGVRAAVPRQERRALVRLIQSNPDDALRIRQEIAAINKRAAKRQPEIISEDCIVYSQTRDGRGHEVPFGPTPVRNFGLMSGHDMSDQVRELLDQQFGRAGWQMVQAAYARSGLNRPPPPECELRILPSGNHYRLEVLAGAPGRRAAPIAGNEEGLIVGEAAFVWNGPSVAAFWLDLPRTG